MSSTFHNKPSLGYAPAYQVSGWPWVSGSSVSSGSFIRFDFRDKVTKEITVHCSEGEARILFCEAAETGSAAENNYFPVPATGSVTLDVKCNHIYITSDQATTFFVYASLTNIPGYEVPALTGAGIDE